MNILVTGAAGFLGSHFCDRLLAGGHAVLGVDNFLTGPAANLDHLSAEPRFTLLEADATGPIELPSGFRPDAIVHMASPASPVDFAPLAIEIMRVNAEGAYHLLETARRLGCRFLLTSTSEVYGDPQVHPQPESYAGHVNPIGPRAVYDESKRYAEAMTAAFRRKHSLDARIVRIFNTYGPRMRIDDGRVLPVFVAAALTGRTLPIHGRGTQTRSFCYVTDTCEGIYRALTADPRPAGEPIQPINIGNPDEVTIADLACEVIAAAGSDSRVEFVAAPPDDPTRRCPDISLARRLLDWEPAVSRADGLARTIEDFRQRLAKDTQ